MSASDNFNRADGGLGANWTNGVSSPDIYIIVSNAAQANAVGSDVQEYYNAATFGQNQVSQAEISVTGTGASDNSEGPGVAVRMNDAVQSLYFGNCNKAATLNLCLSKFVSTVFTRLGSATVTLTNGDLLRLEAAGTKLTLSKNGVLGLQTTDTSVQGNRAGIAYGSSGSITVARLDNWFADNIPGLDDYSLFPKPNIAEAAARGEM